MSDIATNKDRQIIEKIQELKKDVEFPVEFNDVIQVLEMGAVKYGPNSWLHGHNFNSRDNHASMSRHLSKATCCADTDSESGLDHLLHLACRALMEYTLKRRKLI